MSYKEIEKFCQECNKKLLLKNTRDIVRKKFCSITCRNRFSGRERMKDPLFKKKIIDSCNTPEVNLKKVHKGENHPGWKGGKVIVFCGWCNKEFKTARHRIKEGNGKYCSRVCFNAWQSSGAKKTGIRNPYEIICRLCGNKFNVQQCLKNTAKYCCIRCHNIGNIIFNPKFKNTSIEIKLKNIADNLGIKYVEHKQIGRITIPDLFVEPNIAIYADGDYWHSRPSTVARDIKINKKMTEMGYKVIRFPEYIINNNPEAVINKLKEIIDE